MENSSTLFVLYSSSAPGLKNPRCLFHVRREMSVFDAVKQSVTTRQAAERYGIRVNSRGMAVCPVHQDKNSGMKVGERYNKPDTTVHYDTVNNLLGYMVGSDCLRNVITQAAGLDRTI